MSPELAEKIETMREARATVKRLTVEIVTEMAANQARLEEIGEVFERSPNWAHQFQQKHGIKGGRTIGRPKGSKSTKKTTPAERVEIKRWRASGIRVGDIARHFKLSHQRVSQILKEQ